MTKEERRLLLVDLCSRLPYGVKVRRPDDGTPDYVSAIDAETGELMVMYNGYTDEIEKFVPYLRPMSSMTEEEKKEYNKVMFQAERYEDDYAADVDWLNKHNFDYRGLIERKLAIDVTKDSNPYEQSK